SAFEKQVMATPDAVAISCAGKEILYQELNQRANRLAFMLIESGTGPEDIVGVLLEPSDQMIVALPGILKSGAAYLPLDCETPQSRLKYMIGDARCALVFTQSKFVNMLPESVHPLTLDSDEPRSRLSRLPDRNPTDDDRRRTLLTANPAYVIYTSGSTGNPKGVV